MIASAPAPVAAQLNRRDRDRISFARLAWVAPLTLAASLGAAFAIKFVAISLHSTLSRMPMLAEPMVALTIEGVVAAIVVFALMALVVPRPIFWYRIVGGVALVLSLLPDLALALGGAPMRLSMSVMGPLTSIGQAAPSGPPPAGFPAGGPPPGGGSFTIPLEQVLVLVTLHVVIALVCIGLLTTLTRARRPAGTVAQS